MKHLCKLKHVANTLFSAWSLPLRFCMFEVPDSKNGSTNLRCLVLGMCRWPLLHLCKITHVANMLFSAWVVAFKLLRTAELHI